MVLKKLEELGYKPKKKVDKKETDKETLALLKEIEKSEIKKEILELLIEAVSESDPRELLIYGMYVKNKLGPERGTKQKDKIEKTFEKLKSTIG
jgi:hypothetical protein